MIPSLTISLVLLLRKGEVVIVVVIVFWNILETMTELEICQ